MSDREANKRIVLDFYDAVVNRKDFGVASAHLGDDYRQHNPLVADGPEGLRAFIAFLREEFPESRSEVMRVIAEGSLVALHIHSVRIPKGHGRAIVDIFRVEDGKIVEHWDVIQDIPTESANPNGMF